MNVDRKKCSKCKEIKPLCKFGKRKTAKDGLRYECKDCRNELEAKKYKEVYKKYHKDWYSKNKERHYRKCREWVENNREAARSVRRLWHKNKMMNDPKYRLSRNIRERIRYSFSKNLLNKSKNTEDILGCSFSELKLHFESLFKKGMSWDNYGEWEVDHIIPLASASTEGDVIKLNHYTNLQPLWKHENMAKRDN